MSRAAGRAAAPPGRRCCRRRRDGPHRQVKYLIACGAGTGWNICYAHANEVCPTGYMTLSEGAGFNRKAEAPAKEDWKAAIVTVWRPGRFGDAPDLKPE